MFPYGGLNANNVNAATTREDRLVHLLWGDFKGKNDMLPFFIEYSLLLFRSDRTWSVILICLKQASFNLEYNLFGLSQLPSPQVQQLVYFKQPLIKYGHSLSRWDDAASCV